MNSYSSTLHLFIPSFSQSLLFLDLTRNITQSTFPHSVTHSLISFPSWANIRSHSWILIRPLSIYPFLPSFLQSVFITFPRPNEKYNTKHIPSFIQSLIHSFIFFSSWANIRSHSMRHIQSSIIHAFIHWINKFTHSVSIYPLGQMYNKKQLHQGNLFIHAFIHSFTRVHSFLNFPSWSVRHSLGQASIQSFIH